jgi:hypothetical protein
LGKIDKFSSDELFFGEDFKGTVSPFLGERLPLFSLISDTLCKGSSAGLFLATSASALDFTFLGLMGSELCPSGSDKQGLTICIS